MPKKTKRGRSYFEYLRPLFRLTINHGSVLGKVDISSTSPTLPITWLFWELISPPDSVLEKVVAEDFGLR